MFFLKIKSGLFIIRLFFPTPFLYICSLLLAFPNGSLRPPIKLEGASFEKGGSKLTVGVV
jgi:hypothetical protein